MGGELGGLVAVVAAWTVFAVWARCWNLWTRNHSPTEEVSLWDWVKRLVTGDPDPEPGPDPDPSRRRGYRLAAIDERKTAVEWDESDDPPPPADPADAPRSSRLDRWVAASLARGARPADIIAQGRRTFRVSESTVKRAIGRVRRGRERAVRPSA